MNGAVELVHFNERVVSIKKEYHDRKHEEKSAVLRKPPPDDPRTVIGLTGERLSGLIGDMVACVERITLLSNVSTALHGRFPDMFFPNLCFFQNDMHMAIECLTNVERAPPPMLYNKAITLTSNGLSINVIKWIIKNVNVIYNDMVSFVICCVLMVPHELCVHMLMHHKSEPCMKTSFYRSIYERKDRFELIKQAGRRILPFYERSFESGVILTQSSNQKPIEKIVELDLLSHQEIDMFSLFDNDAPTTLEGYLYDYLIYSHNTGNIIVVICQIADLLGMKIDNVVRRLYTLIVDKATLTIRMSSRLCNYESVPELTVAKIDTFFIAYISLGDRVSIKRVNINNLLGEERVFEFRNHRYGDTYCMVLNRDRFIYTDTNNKIQVESGQKIIGTTVQPSVQPAGFNNNAPMLFFIDEENTPYGFFPTYRCPTDDHFVFDTESIYSDYNRGLISAFSNCAPFSQNSVSRAVFEGNIQTKDGGVKKPAKMMIEYVVFISNTKKLNFVVQSIAIQTSGML